MGIIEELIYFIAQFLAAAIVLSFHEFAHAYAAHKCGDDTARLAGRLTLNPMVHFDLWGIIMFALAGFGWAKPVPVNPRNFRDFKKGSFWTSIAGVLMNLCMAFLIYPIFLLVMRFIIPLVSGMYLGYFLYYFFNMLFVLSLSFCVFNLLPLYPLDGFRIVEALDKKRGSVYKFLQKYGYYILLGLVCVHLLSTRVPVLGYVDLLGYVMRFVMNIFSKPITLLWNWVFYLF